MFAATCCTAAKNLNADDVSPYENILSQNHIDHSAKGLKTYLRGLIPGKDERARQLRLVKQLGSDDFFERESAMQALSELRAHPVDTLFQAARGNDAEVRWRAKIVLERYQAGNVAILHAVLTTIAQRKYAGMIPELLQTIPVLEQNYLKVVAFRAIRNTATPGDAPQLRAALKNRNTDLRRAAIEGLLAAVGKDALPDLNAILENQQQDDLVTLAAARAVAGFGDSQSLPVLLRLMSSRDVNVSRQSVAILRAVTGQHWGYETHLTEEKRTQAVARWKTWIDQNGRTAKLLLPLQLNSGDQSFLYGNTLLALQSQNKVVEYDTSQQEIWSYSIRSPWSAEKLANGNYLITSQTKKMVIEVDPGKEIVWQFESPFPFRARQLKNGNILIVDYATKKITEVDRNKQVIWEQVMSGSCTDAHRLPNGNTLVSIYGKGVVEVTPGKKTVWSSDLNKVFGIQPLRNENILICDYNKGRVVELTRGKNIVWEYPITNPVDVFRLSNGNTLITSRTQVIEVTPDKQIVWSKKNSGYGTARR